MARTPDLNPDYERRSLWQATMAPLPDRTGPDLPDSTDVVVIGGGYTGINAARELARRGVAVTLLEAEALGWGASTRNGGIVHAGYKWSAGELVKRYGDETGRALYRETLDSYDLVKRLIADEAIDCDFREVGHLELAYAPAHVPELEHARAGLAAVGVDSTVVSRERIHEEIGTDAYYGALVVEGSALLHPGRFFAGLAAAAARAGADLHEGVRARSIRRGADGRFVVETSRGAILARDVFVGTNGYTDGVVPSLRRRIIPIGSYIIASEPLPEDLVGVLSPKGRAFFDTKNFLYYWHISADRRMVFGGRASFMPTSIDHTAAILWRGLLEVHPQLADYRIEYAWGGNVGFTFDRMPHVGRTRDGIAYAMGCCGTGVAMMTNLGTKAGAWLAGGEAPELARLAFPLVPAPYEGRPWFMPFAGEWYRLQDWLAARSRRAS
ncbi:MAG: NAD(P)/FAD-dependent oxidoreductase [Candidatus Limnocylindrales bacterium]